MLPLAMELSFGDGTEFMIDLDTVDIMNNATGNRDPNILKPRIFLSFTHNLYLYYLWGKNENLKLKV